MTAHPRETHPERVELHVAGVCIREPLASTSGPEILLQRRAAHRELFPGKLEGCGGQVRPGETWSGTIRRLYVEELGVVAARVDGPGLTMLYEIDELQGSGPILGVRVLCIPVGTNEDRLPDTAHWYPLQVVASMDPDDFAGNCHEQILALAYRFLAQRQAGGW